MHLPQIKKSLDRVLHPLDYDGRQQAKEAKLEKRFLKENKPKPLPSSRVNITQESLVTELPVITFFRLPLEIRMQIYELVLGQRLLHLIHYPGCIKHIDCGREHAKDVEIPSHQPAAYNVAHWRNNTTTGLPLLLTCKTIYREAIHVLYRTNTFSLSDLNILRYWRDLPLVRLQHFQDIHQLKISWTYYKNPGLSIGLVYEPYDWSTWQRFWNILAREMPNLRKLELALECVGMGEEVYVDQPFVKVMMEVRGIEQSSLDISTRDSMKNKRCPDIEEALAEAWRQPR